MRPAFRPLLPIETDWEKITLLTLPATFAAGGVWLWQRWPVPACPFKAATGCPCPGCGASRATRALAEGRWQDAMQLNPLWTVTVAAIGAYWLYAACTLITRRGLRLRPAKPIHGVQNGIRAALGIAVLTNWWWVVSHLPESPWLAR